MKRIIVCPDDFKKKRLSSLYSKKQINEDFYISLEQLKEKMFFKIQTEAKLFARDYLNVKYSVAVTLLNNIYYLENDYKHENLDKLRNLKEELIKNNLLTFDNLFPFYLKRHEVIVMGYLLSKEDMILINEVKKYTNVVIQDVQYQHKQLEVMNFNTIDEEIDYAFKNIIKLIDAGVKLADIKICNIDSSYIHLLRRYSSFYNIKINFKKDDSLLSSPVVNKFLELYKENKNLEEVIDQLKERFNNNDIVKKILVLINEVQSSSDLTDVFLYEFEKLKFDEDRFDNAVEIVDFYNYQFSEFNYIFIMNFNSGAIPKEFKDDQYLSDNITSNINLDTTQDKIKLELEQIKIKLFNMENVFISYKKLTKSKEYIPSRLVNVLEMKTVEPIVTNEYSLVSAKIKAAIYLEEFIKYDTLNNDLFKYYYLIENIFNTFKNDYSQVDVELVKKRLDNNIKLSYTSLSTYYKCSFAFYLERVLKIRVNDGNFSADIGTIFHEILEKMEDENYDYIKELELFKEKFTTNKDLFFYNKLTNEFLETLEIIKEQNSYTALDEFKPELQFKTITNNVFNREFMGLVDKVIYRTTPNHTYIAVIDYKTGHIKSTLDNVEEGFNLQLPIYAYMLKNSKEFNSPIILGMFLQKILNKTPNYNPKVLLEDQKKENLKLQGYVIGEEDLAMLDKEYENSKMISKLKVNKKGELDRFSKVLTQEKFDELALIVENLIDNAFDNIEKMNFDINPKLINNVNESCMFCKYESICFKKTKDNIYLEKTNILKGSDENVDETTKTSD